MNSDLYAPAVKFALIENTNYTPFQRKVFNYSTNDLHGFHDHLRDRDFPMEQQIFEKYFSKWIRVGCKIHFSGVQL